MNLEDCCRVVDGSVARTEWYFPNMSRVESAGGGSFHRTRGPQVVILHHDGNFIVSGIFQCQIRNNSVYFGIYEENEGGYIIT